MKIEIGGLYSYKHNKIPEYFVLIQDIKCGKVIFCYLQHEHPSSISIGAFNERYKQIS